MRTYDYSFLKTITIPARYNQVLQMIASMKYMNQSREKKQKTLYQSLKEIAVVQSVKSSNAIEGIVTTDERIKAIVNKEITPKNHDEQEIAGYRDALNYIHSHHHEMMIDEDTILFIHRMMLDQTSVDYLGIYKQTDNYIIERKPSGEQRLKFKPVSAKETHIHIKQLILAFTSARQDSDIDPLLLIPCFVLDFLSIHPFRDGNGRLSRLLTLLLLYQENHDVISYVSFEDKINDYKQQYYDTLESSSQNWHENNNDYLPFIYNFLFTLRACYKEIDDRFLIMNDETDNKKTRIKDMIVNSIIPVSKKDIKEMFPDIAITTIEITLAKLLKQQIIIKVGSYKNAKYKKA